MRPNSLSELLAGDADHGVSPEDFTRVVFGPVDQDELTEGLPPPHPQYVRDAILVLRKALEVNPDERRVLEWFLGEHLSDFGMATPKDVVASGRVTALLAYLESIESGSGG